MRFPHFAGWRVFPSKHLARMLWMLASRMLVLALKGWFQLLVCFTSAWVALAGRRAVKSKMLLTSRGHFAGGPSLWALVVILGYTSSAECFALFAAGLQPSGLVEPQRPCWCHTGIFPRSMRLVSFFSPVPKPQNYKGMCNTFLALGTVVMHVASC